MIQNKTDTEKKLDEALSNKPWGASSTLLNDLSRLTFSLCVGGVSTGALLRARACAFRGRHGMG